MGANTSEQYRLAALHAYHILDTAEEKDFDELTTLASVICNTPIALVSLVDQHRQWFKSHKGLAARQTPIEQSFCAQAIKTPDQIMIIPDAHRDVRFRDNPLVTGETQFTFYAGVPLVDTAGFALGSLCVIDHETRELSREQTDALQIVARQVVEKLEARREASRIIEENDELQRSLEDLEYDHLSLKTTEERFRKLVSEAPVAIAILRGRKLLIESANEQMLACWGKQDNVVNKTLASAMPELEGQPFFEILDNVFTSGKSFLGTEVPAQVRENEQIVTKYFNFVYQPMKDDKNNTHSLMLIASDVSAQVNARRLVNDLNERFQLALDAGGLGSYDLDIDTGIIESSPGFKKSFGRNEDAVFNLPELLECIVPVYRDQAFEKMQAAMSHGTNYEAEYPVTWADGSTHWISAFGKINVGQDPTSARHLIGVTRDITERKEIEKRRDDFLGIVSHELKTPLTTMKASLQLLEQTLNDAGAEIGSGLVAASSRSADKISTLVNDLLNMHRFNEHQLNLDKTVFNIHEMLDLSCRHLRTGGVYNLVVNGDPLLDILADEHRIEQVIVNLVDNAVKYAPNSRTIYLGFEEEEQVIRFTVTDMGVGIRKEDLPYIFDRYWRADHSSIRYSGLGLGLYICAEIVRRHGGGIGAISEPGEGSTFWFTLPK